MTKPPSRTNSIDSLGRKKHVEVCARIRPLTIGNVSSSSYFHVEPETFTSNIIKPKQSAVQKLRKAITPPRNGLRKAPLPRPFRRKEHTSATAADEFYAWNVASSDTVNQSPKTELVLGRTHSYTLDRVFGPEVSTQELYDESCLDLVRAAMDGYHTSVLAYGQTSTGKTHTMTGTTDQPGIIPLCVQECFNCLETTEQEREYLLRVSYLEVYKEHIRDLLAAHATPVRLFDSADGLVIKGLQEEIVTSPEQVFELLTQGESRRQVGATHMNQHSSRSHVLVRIWIESKDSSSKNGTVRVSSLSLVDLAGSESVRLTGSSERREEGHYINKSLMTLGQVVYALSENNEKKHIPYRDSKLTRLLQPSLSGNAQVVLLCCISPRANHVEESHNTFKFASRAKKIPQKALIQEQADEKTMLQGYREEIEDLKQQLLEARKQQADSGTTATTNSTTSTTPSTTPDSSLHVATDIVTEGEVNELVEAIQTMEKLILKSNPISPRARPEDLLDLSEGLSDDGDEEADLMALVTNEKPATPTIARPKTPRRDDELQNGLSHVQGLLGSVLKRRMGADQTQNEIHHLRQQLEEQQAATSLKQADASFLQAQLEEKNNLLQEVGKILEAVEQRQARLEAENESLRQELEVYKKQADSPTAAHATARLEF